MRASRILGAALALILSASPIAFANSAKLHVDVGLNHFYKKRYLEAFKEFQTAAEIDPKYAEARYNMGRVYKIQGFLKEAALEFQAAVAIDPNYLAARRELDSIKSYLQQDVSAALKIQGQEEALRQRVQEAGTNTAEKRAQELLRQGKTDAALQAFVEAVRSDPYNARLHKMVGFLSFKQGRYSNALTAYEQAKRQAPDDPEIDYALGLIHLRTQNYEKAAETIERALAATPNMIKAIYALGEAYEGLGRYEDATFQFRKCLSIDPNLSEAQSRLRELAGRLSYTYFSRGTYYYQQGEFEKAEALLSLARQYGALTPDQRRQVEEMTGAARYWVGKKKAEDAEKAVRREITSSAYIGKPISIEDVVRNPTAYMGKAVEWEGDAVYSDESRGNERYFVNMNGSVNPDSNMDYTFGIVFPKSLPNDPRVSSYSQIRVKGKIVKMEKLLNTFTTVQSSRPQPIIEASEVSFQRESYPEALNIRYY
ncbi:MAG TPA: tetratricopeptide repeat protein [Candidatus Ozemobacteraceae bacterium]|nr:tetratricopeptide repeat protein [Candidatus Ozemobacteraceae bacterium]